MMKMKNVFLKYAAALSIIIAAIVTCERLVTPKYVGDYSATYLLLNYLPLLGLAALFFSISNRVIFSSFLSSLSAVTVVIASNIKYKVLEAPVIPTDFLLLPQIIKTPKLYLSYLPKQTYLILAAVVLLGALLYYLERKDLPATRRIHLIRVGIFAAALFTFFNVTTPRSVIGKIYKKSSLKWTHWQPSSSVQSAGLFYTLVRLSRELGYVIPEDHGDVTIIEKLAKMSAGQSTALPSSLPDIVIVQNESFYDVRQHEVGLSPPVYEDFDAATAKSALSGRLRVPTIAGNTILTEFSFLTGIDGSILPPGCEYPYRSVVKSNIWSIAWFLKTLRYKTVAVHPHVNTFWDRNKALPLLGFDEFIDERYFGNGQKEGPYTSDAAVTEQILRLRKTIKSPLFIFAITMENHGPWKEDRVASPRKFQLQGDLDVNDRAMLGRYLHHIADSATMASELVQELGKDPRHCVLAFYGDHAPGLDDTLRKVPLKVGRSLSDTPYFIYRNFGPQTREPKDMDVAFLAAAVLDEAGLNRSSYFFANSYMRGYTRGLLDRRDDDVRRSFTQLQYNNLSGKLADVRFTAKRDVLGELGGSSVKIDLADYGPKVVAPGAGTEPDGSAAIWISGKKRFTQNHIIFANNTPLKTDMSDDSTVITASLPKDCYRKAGSIDVWVQDTAAFTRSKRLRIEVRQQ